MVQIPEIHRTDGSTTRLDARKPPRPNLVVPDYFKRKVIFMRVLAALLLVVFAPLMLLCMALVVITSSGPALFRQTRWAKTASHSKSSSFAQCTPTPKRFLVQR